MSSHSVRDRHAVGVPWPRPRIISREQLSTGQTFFMLGYRQPVDHHRLIKALRPIYEQRWISTGASKGGMTSVYHRRFYPDDVDGTVAYVAPDDVNNVRDVYVPFIQRAVDDRTCNAALRAFQRTTLQRRTGLVRLLEAFAAENGLTYTNSSSGSTPESTDQEIFDSMDALVGWRFYSDQGLEPFVPYFYQASRQLGWPDVAQTPWLRGLQHYREAGSAPAKTPPSIRPRFEPNAMRDIDRWVRTQGRRLLFVYGENDPWSAEPFTLGGPDTVPA